MSVGDFDGTRDTHDEMRSLVWIKEITEAFFTRRRQLN
jgi:hypothetical protein